MKTYFNFEFHLESPDEKPFIVKEGYFGIDLPEKDTEKFNQLSVFVDDLQEKVLPKFEKWFGSHDIQIKNGCAISYYGHEIEKEKFKSFFKYWMDEFNKAGFKTDTNFSVVDQNVFFEICSNLSEEEKFLSKKIANSNAHNDHKTPEKEIFKTPEEKKLIEAKFKKEIKDFVPDFAKTGLSGQKRDLK